MPTTDADQPLGYRELRVHGIGDHRELSAQGRGTRVDVVPAEDVANITVNRAPTPPRHEVRFLNWSRASRARVPPVWYLAFPYTLLNTAGWMVPCGASAQWWHRVVVRGWGLALTAGTAIWVVATTEVVLRYVAGSRGDDVASFWLPLGFGLLVPVVIGLRFARSGLRGGWATQNGWAVPAPLALLHLLVATATLVVVGLARPARDTVVRDSRCLLGPEGRFCVVFAQDWVTIFAYGSVAASVVVALVLGLTTLGSRDVTAGGREANPLWGSGVALVLSTALLHACWSVAGVALQFVGEFLQGYALTRRWVLRGSGTLPDKGVLLPYNVVPLPRESTLAPWLYGPDLVVTGLVAPIAAIVGLILVIRAVPTLIRGFRRRFLRADASPVARPPNPRWARLTHQLVTGLSGRQLVVGAMLLLLVEVTWLAFLAHRAANPSPALVDVIRLITGGSAVALLLVAAVKPVREPLAVVGDVVGFWLAAHHPLAALPYRNDVLGAIKRQLTERDGGDFVLVGHSQGSVLCFEALRQVGRRESFRVHLVTCGSPLLSLYGRFFPRSFGPEQFSQVNEIVSTWRNFWRQTDPISTAMPSRDGDEAPLPDPQPGQLLRKHSDYWLEEEQNSWIADRVAPLPGASPGGEAPRQPALS